jgi:hypothetical protein
MEEKEQEALFSEILGALVAGVSHARKTTDTEALRIAHQYRKSELLKGLPVPRLRIQKISISLPVILKDFVPGEPARENSPRKILEATIETLGNSRNAIQYALGLMLENGVRNNQSDNERKRTQFYSDLVNYITPEIITEDWRKVMADRIGRAILELQVKEGGELPSDTAIRDAVGNVVDTEFRSVFHEVIFGYLKELHGAAFDENIARLSEEKICSHPYIKEVLQNIRQTAEKEAIHSPTISPDFKVSVNTDNIKTEGGGPDTVTRLSMVLLEEGLEWLAEKQYGTERKVLIPE